MAHRRSLALTFVVLLLSLGSIGVRAQSTAADVSGKWTMRLESHQGELSLALTLKQTGDTLTGTWATPHGSDVALRGTLKGGKLALASAEQEDVQVTFAGAVRPDGTLAGTLSSAMGDAKWTATRAK